jgi:hypothetical protein
MSSTTAITLEPLNVLNGAFTVAYVSACSTWPSFTLYLGTLGNFSLSPALVLQLRQVFTYPTADWTAELLYMPCLIPFVVVSGATLLLFRKDLRKGGVGWREPFANAWRKVKGGFTAWVGSTAKCVCVGGGGALMGGV